MNNEPYVRVIQRAKGWLLGPKIFENDLAKRLAA